MKRGGAREPISGGPRDRGSDPGRRGRNRRPGGGGEGGRTAPPRDPGGGGASETIAGWHPVHEALRAGSRAIGRILIATDRHAGRIAEILRLAREANVPVTRVPAEALKRLLPPGVPHQGVVAEIAPKAYVEAGDLLEKVGSQDLFLVLDEIQDPRNLGAILRTAAAVAATGVFIPERRSAALGPAAVRASAGGVEAVPVARVTNLGKLLHQMGEAGVYRVGLDPAANDLHTSLPGDRPLALVLGGEERGVRPSVREACDLLVRIPIRGPVASLNVSVAAGIALYEVLRVRSFSIPGKA
jgi:23S rRNA (guanosine2251-2'-O)-methyltransferase